jgi:ankyrin repeat protein
MSGKVNTASVQAAAERQMRAAATGHSYEEQLKIEGVGGRFGGTNRTQLQVGQPGQGQQGQQAQQGQDQAQGQRGQGRGGRGQRGGQGAANANAGQAAAAQGGDDNGDQDVIFAGLVGTGGGGLTPLVLAAREGDIESTKLLLDKGANVNQVTEYSWSPLLTATNNRHYKLGEYLIERGANVNLANKGNWTPLYLATDNRNIEGGDFPVPKPDMDNLEYIQFLLEHGADPNLRAKDNTLTRTIFTMQWFFEAGATPFVRAAQSSDLELLKLLIKHGADPLLKTDFNDTALTAAAGIGWVEGVTYEHSPKENVETVRYLLDLGLDPNGANNDGRTPLMGAALKGRNEVVQMLVDRGAKLDQRDKGSRDTDTVVSVNAGHTWQPVDYADGLVRVGVQSAIARPETGALIRKLMAERNMPFPPINRTVYSVCVVELCKERVPVPVEKK